MRPLRFCAQEPGSACKSPLPPNPEERCWRAENRTPQAQRSRAGVSVLTPEQAGNRIPLDSLPVLGTLLFFPMGVKFSKASGTCIESESQNQRQSMVDLGEADSASPVCWYPGQGLHPLGLLHPPWSNSNPQSFESMPGLGEMR